MKSGGSDLCGVVPPPKSATSPMQALDVVEVVQVHLQSFPGFFLTFLGQHFLSELYRGILEDASGIAYVYRSPERLLGFVAGTGQPQGFYIRLLRQRWLRFAWSAAWPAIQKPSIIPRLLRAFSRDRAEDVHENCATLMSIAVAPQAQGQGVGQALILAFLQECARRGIPKVNLTTDALDNDPVNRFYVNSGFTLQQSFLTPEGRKMNEYVITLPRVP